MTDDRVQLNLRVSEDQKASWEEYADESVEVDSLSHLVRLAVAREVSGAYDRDAGGTGTQIPTEQLGEIETAIKRVERTVGDIDDRVAVLEREAESNKPSPAEQVYEALPPAKPYTEAWKRAIDERGLPRPPHGLPHGDPIAWLGTQENIREVEWGPDDHQVVEAGLEQLLEDDSLPSVETAEIDGEQRYWKG
jgi:hypothetical protein